MQLTILVPDEIGQRVRDLPDPDRFVTKALRRAFHEPPAAATGEPRKPVRKDPVLEGRLVERDGLLVISGRLEGPYMDHRQIRREYLDQVTGPVE